MSGPPRLSVIGHTEWVEFARTDHLPGRGEVAHATSELSEPAGGGAVVAVQFARLAGECRFHTALGDDETGARARARLSELGVTTIDGQLRAEPTRRALTLVDGSAERTIITLGPRLEPCGEQLGELSALDGLYFTAGDGAALTRARAAARVLTLTPRAASAARDAQVELDALIYSASDELEIRLAGPIEHLAKLVIRTAGTEGGEWAAHDGSSGRWPAATVPGTPRDTYGCGDTFAGGVTYGLAAGYQLADALALGARCAAVCLTGRGPYERMLAADDL